MRPLDPRLLARTRGARIALATDVIAGFLATLLILAQATLFARIVVAAFDGRPFRSRTLVLFALVVVARALLSGVFETTGRLAAIRVMSDLRMRFVGARLAAGDEPEPPEAGEVAAAAVGGVDGLEAYFGRYLPQVVLAVLVPVAVLLWTANIDPTSAAIMLVTLPLIPVFMIVIGRYTEAKTRARWRSLARLSNHFLDVVCGLPTLRAFNRGEVQAERIAATSEAYRRATMETLRVSFLSGAVLDLAATLATALVAVTLGVRLIDGGVGLQAALTVLLLTPELYVPLRSLAALFHVSADGLAAAERILELGEASSAGEGGAPTPEGWHALTLRDVVVRYPARAASALDGVDLTVRRGETVALTGPSGAGKSTVAALLLGLRRPEAGRIEVDGADLAGFDVRAWHRQVAWMPQRPTVFRGTVRENIALGKPGASETELRAAAARAGFADVVDELPEGFDTVVGEGGRELSAGELRRLAVARALVSDAPLLILDEPTANLDPDNADAIAAAIGSAGPDRAVLVIAHDPKLAGIADRIVRLQDGRIAAASTEAGVR